jgi:hypothetical protein
MHVKWLVPMIVGFGLATAAPAVAAPIAPAPGISIDSLATTVQHRDRDRRHMNRSHDRRGHMNNSRHRRDMSPRRGYRSPPPGWQRYNSRPGNWQRRGCSQIGPVWFCP